MLNAADKFSFKDEVMTENNPEQAKPNVLDLTAGKILAAREYADYDVFLVSGQAELQRRGMADQLLRSTGHWNAKDNLFNEVDHDTYIRCTKECQFLLLPKQKDLSVNGKAIKSERLFTQVETKSQISSYAPELTKQTKIDSAQKADNSVKTIEVSIYDLDRAYDDTVELPPEINSYLTKQRDDISESKAINYISNIAKSLIKQVAKGDAVIKKVGEVLTEKVPSTVDGIADLIDKSLESSPELQEENVFSTIGYWKALEIALPGKSGVYYVSDGRSVKATYFNKNRQFFHKAENMKIIFWSSKKFR